ncbi:hypothetical protein BRM87_10285, partial [Xanthomonas oryzae pv. oryzae]
MCSASKNSASCSTTRHWCPTWITRGTCAPCDDSPARAPAAQRSTGQRLPGQLVRAQHAGPAPA